MSKSRDVRRRDGTPEVELEQSRRMIDEQVAELSEEELREFLQADLLGVPVDPKFKQRLKRRLWDLVLEQKRLRESTGKPKE